MEAENAAPAASSSLIQVRTKLLDLPGGPAAGNGRSNPGAIRCDRPTLVVAMPVSLVLNCQRPLYQERALGCPAYAVISPQALAGRSSPA